MAFSDVNNGELLQVKKECYIKYKTERTKRNSYIRAQTIRFTNGVYSAKFSYKGLNYEIVAISVTDFIDKCKLKLQLLIDFTIADMTKNIVRFTKKDKFDLEIVFEVNANYTLTDITDVEVEEDLQTTIKLAILDNYGTVIGLLNKAVNGSGEAIFQVNSQLQNFLGDNFVFQTEDFHIWTELIRKFTFIGSDVNASNDSKSVDIYAINANLNADDSTMVVGKNFLTKCKEKEFTFLSNQKLYVLFNGNTSFGIEVFLTDSTKAETTVGLEGQNLFQIYKLNTSWEYIKTLFPALDETKVYKYNVINNHTGEVVTYNFTKQAKREFVFINRFGVFETILFKDNDQKEINLETERIQSSSNFIFETKKVASHKRIINTGFISSQNRRNELTDFFCSEKVYEVVGETLVPIYIDNDNVAIKLLDKMEIHNIEITYFYSQNQKIL